MNKKTIIISLAVLVVVGIVYWMVFSSPSERDSLIRPGEEDEIQREEKVVVGNSLDGIIGSGETINALLGYYDYYEIERGDIVLYNYGGSEDPIIKIVKAVPGDSFSLEEVEGGWNIIVNGEILENSLGEKYLINEPRYNMLSLYQRDYGEEIPEYSYMLLGNLAGGSTDSTRFGLIHKDDILGKVEER